MIALPGRTSRRWSRAALIAGLLLSAGVAPPAAAQPAGPLAEVLDLTDRISGGALEGTLEGAVRAAALAGGVEPVEATVVPAPVPPGVPSEIAEPVARLLGAADAAEDLGRRAILDLAAAFEAAATLEADLAMALAALELPRGEGLDAPPPAAVGASFVSLEEMEQARRRVERSSERVDEIVDRAALATAALVVAREVDRALPTLVAYAAGVPAPPGVHVGCDVVEVPDVLCIGGAGQNVYEDDFRLHIDLGGDDLYTNTAAGAAPYDGTWPPAAGDNPVAILIDLDGDDRYESAVAAARGTFSGDPVQGSGWLGGVGVLVDVAGNDVYSATTTQPGPRTHAQGHTLAGVGILADLGGNDTYRMDDPFQEVPATSQQAAESGASGQANGGLGGLSVVLDLGGGDDRYEVRSAPDLVVGDDGWLQPAQVAAAAFGVGALGGVGLHVDDGGRDTFEVLARSAPVAPDDPRPIRAPWATASGFGFGIFGGAGVAVSGPGDTVRTVRAESRAPAINLTSVTGFGTGGFGTLSMLHDAGGDDLYLAEAVAEAVRHGVLDDSCACRSRQFSAVNGPIWGSVVRSHAGGALVGGDTGNVNVLRDDEGDDRYVSRVIATTRTEARDLREGLPDPEEGVTDEIRAFAYVGRGISQAQGSGFSNGTVSVLLDAAGDDVYESVAHVDASAEATAVHPDVRRAAEAYREEAFTFSQGYGASGGSGFLYDLGGRDAYAAVAEGGAHADPPTIVESLPSTSFAQGAVDAFGAAVFVDEGDEPDTFLLTPDRPACLGVRGQGVWADCATPGAALGVNRSGLAGADGHLHRPGSWTR